ncbi:MAG: PhzF family phenazine biosynthesis protein [Deltaproteobacteria bacterium]|jgi:PhzF family phenazine biosynthesis protein|nr:PhzF family phenazine biosynthesis protein [Deltaproteobacteria bacterium]
MIRKIFLVDAFADGPFTGASTSVAFLKSPLEKYKMSSLAAELGSQETAFVLATNESYLLRFFSQTQEVPLSIHACLAAAHLIYELGLYPPSKPLKFHTQEGQVAATLSATVGNMTLTTSSQLLTKLDQARLEQFRALAGLGAKDVAWAALSPQKVAILSLEKSELVEKAEIDLAGLLKTPVQGLALTSPLTSADGDYCLRTFLPAIGVSEEEVSGNIHRSLAPQWGRLLQKKTLVCRQLSKRRGLVYLDLINPNQVTFNGQAKTFLKGELAQLDWLND